MKLLVKSQAGQRFLIDTNDEPDYMTKYLMEDGKPFGHEVKVILQEELQPVEELPDMEDELDEMVEETLEELEENPVAEVIENDTVKPKARRGRKSTKK